LGFWSDLHGVLIHFVRVVSKAPWGCLNFKPHLPAIKRLHFIQKRGFCVPEHA